MKQSSPFAQAALPLAMALLLLPVSSANSKYKVLHAFGHGKDGAGLRDSLALDEQGNLYGTTTGGGDHNSGTVFKLVPYPNGRWTESVLHSFCSLPHCSDGALPFANVTLDRRGSLFGATNSTIFKMTHKSGNWDFSILDSSYGSWAGVVLDRWGDLYGNIGVGEYEEGAVTELTPGLGGWTQNYLYSFCQGPNCPDGAAPVSGVVFDSTGNLYGTTEYGGTGWLGGLGGGTTYQLQHNSDGTWQHVILHSFPAYRGDGVRLLNGMVLDQSENLYGATIGGGSIDCGVIFKLTHSTGGWSESLVHDFTPPIQGYSLADSPSTRPEISTAPRAAALADAPAGWCSNCRLAQAGNGNTACSISLTTPTGPIPTPAWCSTKRATSMVLPNLAEAEPA